MSRNVTVAAIVQLRRREMVNAAPTSRDPIASAPLFVVGAGGQMTVLVLFKQPYTKKHRNNDIAFGFVDNIKAQISPTTMRRRYELSGADGGMPPASVAAAAQPLSRKPQPQHRPHSSNRPRSDDRLCRDRPHAEAAAVRGWQGDMESNYKLHQENRAKATEAANRQHARQVEQERQHRQSQQMHVSQLREQQSAAAAAADLVPPAPQRQPAHAPWRPRQSPHSHKRKETPAYTSPHTNQPPQSKRRSTTASCRLVWKQDGAFGPSNDTRDSFVDVALKEGSPRVYLPPPNLASNALRDGLTIVQHGGAFSTMHGDDIWYSSNPWAGMASKIVCAENPHKVEIVSDCGLGLRQVGSGTYNIVVIPTPEVTPDWLKDKNIVYRITRSDCQGTPSSEKQYKYETLSIVAREAENAMFAAGNDIGVGVHSISSFHGIRHARTLRYGTIYSLEKADVDLFRALERCQSFDGGALIAVQVTELLFKASRCGVAFFDIKPANILRMQTDCNGGTFRLTDFDPSFFIRLPDEDWRTLLLLNLALLSAHVRNQSFASSAGFCAAVEPVLRQLVRRRAELHKSDWLFDVRSVCVNIETPENRGEFQMQRIFAVMASSYFYNPHKKQIQHYPSAKYKWEKKDQAALDRHWSKPKNRDSWPPEWKHTGCKPLIVQLVDFALDSK